MNGIRCETYFLILILHIILITYVQQIWNYWLILFNKLCNGLNGIGLFSEFMARWHGEKLSSAEDELGDPVPLPQYFDTPPWVTI